MGSRHLDRSESTRVPTDVSDAARAALDARGWSVHAFLGAALRALVAQPERLLALLAEYRPEKKSMGRPKRPAAGKAAGHKPAPKAEEVTPVVPERPDGLDPRAVRFGNRWVIR